MVGNQKHVQYQTAEPSVFLTLARLQSDDLGFSPDVTDSWLSILDWAVCVEGPTLIPSHVKCVWETLSLNGFFTSSFKWGFMRRKMREETWRIYAFLDFTAELRWTRWFQREEEEEGVKMFQRGSRREEEHSRHSWRLCRVQQDWHSPLVFILSWLHVPALQSRCRENSKFEERRLWFVLPSEAGGVLRIRWHRETTKTYLVCLWQQWKSHPSLSL